MNPSANCAYRRLMVLKYLISHSYRSIPSQYATKITNWTVTERKGFEKQLENEKTALISSMKTFGVWDYATNFEKVFVSTLGSKMDERSQLNTSWRMEAVLMLMWALNLIEKFPDINEEANPEL